MFWFWGKVSGEMLSTALLSQWKSPIRRNTSSLFICSDMVQLASLGLWLSTVLKAMLLVQLGMTAGAKSDVTRVEWINRNSSSWESHGRHRDSRESRQRSAILTDWLNHLISKQILFQQYIVWVLLINHSCFCSFCLNMFSFDCVSGCDGRVCRVRRGWMQSCWRPQQTSWGASYTDTVFAADFT